MRTPKQTDGIGKLELSEKGEIAGSLTHSYVATDIEVARRKELHDNRVLSIAHASRKEGKGMKTGGSQQGRVPIKWSVHIVAPAPTHINAG